ncbi:MAG: DUF1365 domain-containing protein [Undibacterium sp.]|nr:DUF1365 domain-containing protein [Opitutaceae bacterium]
MHHRFTPKEHRFVYRIFLFAFDLDELPELHRRLPFFSYNRANLFSFRDRDFFPTAEPLHHPTSGSAGSPPAPPSSGNRNSSIQNLKSRVLAHLVTRGVDLAGGRVVLVTLPRVFGYLFNPVSFYFCYDAAGTCVASLAEVTNTFKEMKPYFLGPETRTASSQSELAAPDSQLTAPSTFALRTPKHFYVSPFSDVDTAFDFTLRAPGERLSIQIDDYVGADRSLTSTLAGPRRALTSARLAWFTLKYPAITLRIIALIHWHAARLWLRRLPWFAKAARPADQRDLYRPHSSLARPASSVAPTAAPSSTRGVPLPATTEAA